MNHKPEIIALANQEETVRCAAKKCGGPGMATLRRRLRETSAEALIVNGEGVAPPVAVVAWESWTRLVKLVAGRIG